MFAMDGPADVQHAMDRFPANREVMRLQPDFSLDYVRRTYPFSDADQADRFAAWLRDAGVS